MRGGARPNTGGARPGAGRPPGSLDERASPEATEAALLARTGLPAGSSAAEIGRALNRGRGSVARALRVGLTVAALARWTR